MAYALQLHRDLHYDPTVCAPQKNNIELSFIDREIRRRTMWACFLMDNFNSSGTQRPTFMREESIKIQLPIKESYFQLDIPGPTEDLTGKVLHPVEADIGQLSNARENMGVAAYMVRAISVWGRINNYLNLGGRDLDPHPIWHPESHYADLVRQTETFNEMLPESVVYNSDNLHTHEIEGLVNQFLFLHVSVQQNILVMNRFAIPSHPGSRGPQGVPKEYVAKAAQKAFHAANRISELLNDAKPYLVVAPFTGYCAFLSSTVHIFGAFSKVPALEETAKKNLVINVGYLSKMKKYWGMFHFMAENLKTQYRACADARQGASAGTDKKPSAIFQYGDWFDWYPHGVSQTDFEDPAVGIKKEKGDDAVLEQKSDYHTVEEFFSTLSPLQPQDRDTSKPAKRRSTKKGTSAVNIQPQQPPNAAIQQVQPLQAQQQQQQQQPPRPQQVQQLQTPHMAQPQPFASQMSPRGQPHTQGLAFDMAPAPFFTHDLLLSPQPSSLMPTHSQQQHNPVADYGSMDSLGGQSNGLMDSWEMDLGMPVLAGQGVGGSVGYAAEPSSAWWMPFNMEPPELGADVDVFAGLGVGSGYSMGSAHGQGMGGGG